MKTRVQAESVGTNAGDDWPRQGRWILAALGVLGVVLVARWSAVWRESPDFAHGWVVPLFAAYLAWERRVDRPAAIPLRSGLSRAGWASVGLVGAVMLAGGRLWLEPFPTWPSALWIFSAGGWMLAATLIALTQGGATVRHFAFPLLFTATALPWPTMLELNLIVPLRVGLAAIAAEVIHALGYPAIPQGTVIEVGRGQVGIDEACSGVRSLQAAIMIGLLLGEIFRLRVLWRGALLAVALVLALVTNLGRTCFLAWQGATRGPEGVAEWHDLAGTAQMGVALGGMVLAAWLWRRHTVVVAPRTEAGEAAPAMTEIQALPDGTRHGWRAVWLVAGTVMVVELGSLAWFRAGTNDAAQVPWRAELPTSWLSFRASPFTASMQGLLQCDAHQIGQWESPQGGRRAGYVLEWHRGHSARQTVATHNPELCLPYSGQRFVAARGTVALSLGDGREVTFRVSEFGGTSGTFYVFYTAWDLERNRPLTPAADDSLARWLAYRVNAVRERQRQFAARAVAVAVYDAPGREQAAEAFVREARGMVRLGNGTFSGR